MFHSNKFVCPKSASVTARWLFTICSRYIKLTGASALQTIRLWSSWCAEGKRRGGKTVVCIDAETESTLCLQLRALIEEWGVEHVRLRVPFSWKRFGVSRAGRVLLEFSELKRIVICVVHADYRLEVEVACTKL